MLKKSSILSVLLVAVLVSMVAATPAYATVYWDVPITVDSSGVVGMYASLALANGNPAIAYYNATNGDLKFVRASDSAGDTWGTPIVIDSVGAVGSHLSLAIVGGNPAISYYASNALRYVRASDASGSAWGAPIIVDDQDNVGLYTSLAVINGNPAISYFDYTNNDLKYTRALDINGASWGAAITVDSDNLVGEYTSLAQVNGRPAISYYDHTLGTLKYVRSIDANGGNWGSPLTLDSGNSGLHTSMQVIDGNPAISYQDPGATSALEYVRASDADGTTWGAPVTVETGSLGAYTSLELIGGKPAISYQSSTGPRYVGATDIDGATWDTPANADSVVSSYTSLLEVGGSPTMAYYDSSNGDLRFVQIDSTPPTVTINQGAQQPDPTFVSPLTFDVVFSEPVIGFETTDVDISGMAGLPIVTVINSGDDMHFTVTIAGLTDGDFVSAVIPAGLVTDQMGNANLVSTSTDNAIFYTTSIPLVSSITRVNASPTAASSVNFTVTFTEPVTGVDTGDFVLTTSGLGATSVTTVNGSASAVYTVTVNTGFGGNGTLRLDVKDNDSILDFNLHPLGDIGVDNGDFTRGESYKITRATFSDVPTSYWAWKQIESVYVAQITGGCDTTPLRYCPGSYVTRAQMSIFLLRSMHGPAYVPPNVNGNSGFSDVPPTYWAAAWIKELAAEGITGGCGGTKFCPAANVTRAQMAVFLLRAKHGIAYIPPDAGASTGFTDVPPTHWAADWIKELAAEGITSGCGGSSFCPEKPILRAQMAVFLQVTFNLDMP
jgi:hypothetical protein